MKFHKILNHGFLGVARCCSVLLGAAPSLRQKMSKSKALVWILSQNRCTFVQCRCWRDTKAILKDKVTDSEIYVVAGEAMVM